MTPKEKAKELVDKLTLSSNAQDGSWMCEDLAKQCALIAVFEIFEVVPDIELWEYWVKVKQEIELL
jgi:hypothetical protein